MFLLGVSNRVFAVSKAAAARLLPLRLTSFGFIHFKASSFLKE